MKTKRRKVAEKLYKSHNNENKEENRRKIKDIKRIKINGNSQNFFSIVLRKKVLAVPFVIFISVAAVLYWTINVEPQLQSVSEADIINKNTNVGPFKTENESMKIKTKNGAEAKRNFQVNVQNQLLMSPIKDKNGKIVREWKEIKPKRQDIDSSVRVYIMNDFISPNECDGLIKAHHSHVQANAKYQPIVCFSEEITMKLYLRQAGVSWADQVTSKDFLQGTRCLNESFSAMLQGRLPWSYSTSFYPGESVYSNFYEEKVKHYTGLDPVNGGKFQITSYEEGIGYKVHTDCTEMNSNLRDRFATILVYLQDVEKGGETEFTELGISVSPKKGRALVWNNMNSEGNCDISSIHQANPVIKGKKYIFQRWYYYHNFPMLGKRTLPPSLPRRSHDLTPRVSCDQFNSGSCRWYDEWNYDHLVK